MKKILNLLLLSLPLGGFAAWQMPPIEFQGPFYQMSAADNNNHIMLVNNAVTSQFAAYYYTNGSYTLSNVFETTDVVDDFSVAMDPSGTSVVVWHDETSETLNSAFFNGSSWSTPNPDPIDNLTGFFSNPISVAMNGPGSAVAVWSGGSSIIASFLTGGTTWSTPQAIGGGTGFPQAIYSANGTAVAIWQSGDTFINNFNGSSWQAEHVLVPTFATTAIGIDANGNAYIAANDGTTITIYPFNANTSQIGTPVFIAPVTNDDDVSIYVAPNGTAVVAWDEDGSIFSSIFNGINWSAPITVTNNGQDPAVSGDINGNALVIYATDPGVSSQFLPAGTTVWSHSEVVTTLAGFSEETSAGLSAGGKGFAAWGEMGVEEPTIFASATIPPTPPVAITGFVCKNTFATQVDRSNVITFTPSTDPGVVSYIISRNGVVIATVPASAPLTFREHNRCKNQQYIYTVTAVDVFDVESIPVTFIFN